MKRAWCKRWTLLILMPALAACSQGPAPSAAVEAACRAKAHASAVRQVMLDDRNSDRAAAGSDDRQLREIEERETALCAAQGGASN